LGPARQQSTNNDYEELEDARYELTDSSSLQSLCTEHPFFTAMWEKTVMRVMTKLQLPEF